MNISKFAFVGAILGVIGNAINGNYSAMGWAIVAAVWIAVDIVGMKE